MSYYFLSLLAFLFITSSTLILFAVFDKKSDSIRKFSALSTLPGISLGVNYFENRDRFYSDNRDKLFVGMRPLNTMDFVYAK